MSGLAELHLSKAQEFLEAAQFCRELDALDAATSNAVSAAINASDALILAAGGEVPRGQDHTRAVGVLRTLIDADASRQLNRALSHKSKAQYESRRCTPSDADEAIRMAGRLVDKAKDRLK